jgi:putative ABC transport system permease protein
VPHGGAETLCRRGSRVNGRRKCERAIVLAGHAGPSYPAAVPTEVRSADRARPDPALHALIRKSIRSRRVRAALAVSGVAASMLLVVVLLAAFRSPIDSLTAYITHAGADYWICPASTNNFVRSAGFLPLELEGAIAGIAGVERVDPIIHVFVRTEPLEPAFGRDADLMLMAIGYRVDGGMGGPPRFVAGGAPHGDREVALDRAAAFRLGVDLGDSLVVNGRRAAVVGLTRGTNLLATQLAFFDADVAARASGLLRQTSFFVVRAPHADSAAIATALADIWPGALVVPRARFLDESLRESASGFLPVLALVALLGVLVSGVFVALLVQGLVEERRLDLATLLALGAGFGALARALLVHALLLVGAGAVTGGLLALVLRVVLDRALPTIELMFTPADLLIAALVFAVAGVLGTLVPVLRLRRIDPLEAFAS